LEDLIVDGPPVGLDLGLARTADKTEATSLAFEVGPCADQAGALIGKRRHLDLKHALAGARAVREDLEDEAGAVQQLQPPFLFEVALLNGRDRTVDKDQPDFLGRE